MIINEWHSLNERAIVTEPPLSLLEQKGRIRFEVARFFELSSRRCEVSFEDHNDGTVSINGRQFYTGLTAHEYLIILMSTR